MVLGRPLFLVGGMVFYGLGVVAARAGGALIDWSLAGLGLLTVAMAQLMNHYSNDYFDREADAANQTPTPWSGGSRVLTEGRLPARAALAGALGTGGLGLALALVAARLAPMPLVALAALLTGIVFAWLYSGPPLFLHRRGLGELVGALVVPGMPALVGYVLQAGGVGGELLLALVPLCLLQFAMLVAVSLPDAAGDAQVGKLTLAVLWGRRRAAQLYVVALLVACLTLPLIGLAGLRWPVALAPIGALPIVVWNSWRVARGAWAKPEAWASLGFWSIGQLVASGGLMLLGFVAG
ncbi:MAG: prenyltransferase [Chloroflexi bacterium OHK40]